MNLLKGPLPMNRANLFRPVRLFKNIPKKLCCEPNYLSSYRNFYRITSARPPCTNVTKNGTLSCNSKSYSQIRLKNIFEYFSDRIYDFHQSKNVNKLALFLFRTIDKINFEEFYRFLELPDTFNSWFVIVELHAWMLMTQVRDHRSGLQVRNELVRIMWLDVEERLKNIGPVNRKILKGQVKELSGRLPITLCAYDEGLLGADIVLANALWCEFFDKHCDNPLKLEVLVRYVRHQIQYLSSFQLRDYERVKEIKTFWMPFTNHVKAIMDS